MKRILFILLTLAVPVLLLAAEPVREWKSKSGKTIIEASLDKTKETDDPDLVYLLKEGTRYKIPFKNLSQADQDYVTEFRKGGKSLDDEDVGLELDDNARGIEIVPAGNRYALLIGVNEYVKPIRSLEFCVNDMKLLAECFEKIGVPKENIFLVTDDSTLERRPTGENIRYQIESVTQLMGPNDQLTIAFSGHGAMVDGKSYLCPCDTNLDNRNSIVSRDWAFEQLENCKAKQKIFIIDACRDEVSFGSQKALSGAKTLEDPIGADTHGFILIASCDKKQKSWEHSNLKHGVFTYYLAEGISGAAKDEDGYVSIMNIFQYASSKTKKYVFKEFNKVQVPTFRQGGEMTDFCIAKLDQAPKPGDRKVEIVNGVEFAFRWCPPGTFKMGSPEGRYNDETQHQVTLTNGFWMMETEVTVGMFKAFVSDTSYESKGITPYGLVNGSWKKDSQISWRNPGFSQDDNHPVTCVSWDDAVAFCKWLSKKIGQNITLPTEAQWEYACRAGTTGAYAGNLDEMAWYWDNSNKTTHPVGTKKPNAWGLYDMHGNVWEWCADWDGGYPSGSVTDPTGPSDGSYCVRRGGGWDDGARNCRSAYRSSRGPVIRYSFLGFRALRGQ